MNIEQINQLLGIDTVNNPFVVNENPKQDNQEKNPVKGFNIMDILNKVDEQEAIQILGDDLVEDENFNF